MLKSVAEDLHAQLVRHVFVPKQIKILSARAWAGIGVGTDAVVEVDGDVTIRDLVRMEQQLLPKTMNLFRGELGVRIRMEWDYIPYWVKDRDDYYAARR